jgi:hypothetical protein
MTMAKPKTELEQRCPSPPYTRWDQRVKPVLLCHLKRINGKSLCISLETDDPEIAKRHMRLLVPMLIAKGRLSADAGAAKVYGPKKNGRLRVKKLDIEVRRLNTRSEAEYGSAAVATAKRWRCPVGIIHYLTGRRPALHAGTYATRRMRARERGKQMPMGDSWEHRRQGGRYFFWNGKVLTARLHINGRQRQWPLKVIDEEKAEALMAPVRVARKHLHRAAAEALNCELGTNAAVTAAAARAGARARLARAIIAAGGPTKLAEFVLKGPHEEVDTDTAQVTPRTHIRSDVQFESKHGLNGWPPNNSDEPAKGHGLVIKESVREHELRRAPDSLIHKAINDTYSESESRKLKPPNVREIIVPVQNLLRDQGYEASGLHIQELAGADRHKSRRRKPGATIASENRRAR